MIQPLKMFLVIFVGVFSCFIFAANDQVIRENIKQINSNHTTRLGQDIKIKLDRNGLIDLSSWKEINNLAGTSYLFKNSQGVYYRIYGHSLIIFTPNSQIFAEQQIQKNCISAIQAMEDNRTTKSDIDLIAEKLERFTIKKSNKEDEFNTHLGNRFKIYVSDVGEKGIYCSITLKKVN